MELSQIEIGQMNKSLSESQSNAISYLRALSLIMIVSCHICQVYGNHWAWVLNVGVQIFFVISGLLYGCRYISNWKVWYVKRFRKIYIPYIIYMVIIFPFYLVFHSECLSARSIVFYPLNLQGMYWGG